MKPFNLIKKSQQESQDLQSREDFIQQIKDVQEKLREAHIAYNENQTRDTLHAVWNLQKQEQDLQEQFHKFLNPHQTIETPEEENDYRGQHEAPDSNSGSPLWNVCTAGTYPEDFYTGYGYQYENSPTLGTVYDYYNKPNKFITIYRAVPKDLVRPKINAGDWVAISKSYVRQHGRSNLRNDYKVIQKTVYARDIFTAGDSIDEWGYDPQPFIITKKLAEKYPASYSERYKTEGIEAVTERYRQKQWASKVFNLKKKGSY